MSKHYVCTSSTRQNNKSKDKYVIMLKRVYTLKFKKLLRISIEEYADNSGDHIQRFKNSKCLWIVKTTCFNTYVYIFNN